MELYEAVEGRRSIRRYRAPATEEQLKRIIHAGALAPSAFNRQGWDVVIVMDPSTIDRIAEIKYRQNLGLVDTVTDKIEEHAQRQKDAFAHASLLVVYHRTGKNEREGRFDGGSAWCLIENMCLAAAAEGLGSRILSFWGEAEEEVDRLLRVPEGKKQVSALNIGVPDPDEQLKPRVLKSQNKWVHVDAF